MLCGVWLLGVDQYKVKNVKSLLVIRTEEVVGGLGVPGALTADN